jgi:protein-tyrosine kinase
MTEDIGRLSVTEVATIKDEPRRLEGVAREWALPNARELYRSIYTHADLGDARTLAVCSAVVGEGKTTTAIGLAITLAQDFPSRRFVLIEADPFRSVLAHDFALAPSPGFFELLRTSSSPSHLCQRTLVGNLHVLPAGEAPENTSALVRSGGLAAVLGAISADHDLAILDVPALTTNSDAQVIALAADASILVARAGMVPRELVFGATGVLGKNLRGVVLNGTESAVPRVIRQLFGG